MHAHVNTWRACDLLIDSLLREAGRFDARIGRLATKNYFRKVKNSLVNLWNFF
jgi:hypothetical protein